MVESEANCLSEEVMLGAVLFGHQQMQVAIEAIEKLVAEAGKPKWDWSEPADNAESQAGRGRARRARHEGGLRDHREAGQARHASPR